MFERIKAIPIHGVQMSDLVNTRSIKVVDGVPKALRTLRPPRIRVRVITLISHQVFIDELKILQSKRVINETHHEMLFEHVTGLQITKGHA